MIHEILEIISNEITRHVPEFEKGIYLARIDDEGRILIQKDPIKNEFVWGGISDQDSRYFYIRHRDSGEIQFEESPNRPFSSCGSKKIISRYELRLVASLRNWCSYNLEDRLRRALMSIRIPDTPEMKSAIIQPRRSQIDSIAVLKEETPKPKQFEKSMIFVAIDFDLIFEMNYF